jgi:hypothetical protein
LYPIQYPTNRSSFDGTEDWSVIIHSIEATSKSFFERMSYVIAAISNAGGAPEQAYRKMQSAGACPERPYAGTFCCC